MLTENSLLIKLHCTTFLNKVHLENDMKGLLLITVLVCACKISVSSDLKVSDDLRTSRFISGLFSAFGYHSSNSCGECPEHHCRFEESVILGYCCGCKRVRDKAPIRCPYHLDCPPSPQPLCSEYDYMMDCCC